MLSITAAKTPWDHGYKTVADIFLLAGFCELRKKKMARCIAVENRITPQQFKDGWLIECEFEGPA